MAPNLSDPDLIQRVDRTAEQLASYAEAVQFSDLSPGAIHAVKRSVLDSIGCALGAFNAQPMKALRALASRVSAIAPATLFGTDIRTSPEWAGLVNGAMVRYLDFSDDYFGGAGDVGPHPSDNIGSIVAAVESTGSGGKALVVGIAVAYEICAQLLDHFSIYGDGWDYPILHSISTALAVGNVWGLSGTQMRNALGIAVVANVCLAETRLGEISNWKGIAGPNGSRSGLLAALMAEEGITGPRAAFEGQAGLVKQLKCSFDLGSLRHDRAAWKIEGTYFKHLPVGYGIQLPVAIALRARKDIMVECIDSICVHVDKRAVVDRALHPNLWNPASRETADHSAPYLIAAALVDGVIDEQTFAPERYRDPALLSLVEKITIVEDPRYTASFPGTIECRFEITLNSGAVVTIHDQNPKGHPANPMSDAELETKFQAQTDRVLSSRQSRALIDAVWNLEDLADLGKLFSLMRIARR